MAHGLASMQRRFQRQRYLSETSHSTHHEHEKALRALLLHHVLQSGRDPSGFPYLSIFSLIYLPSTTHPSIIRPSSSTYSPIQPCLHLSVHHPTIHLSRLSSTLHLLFLARIKTGILGPKKLCSRTMIPAHPCTSFPGSVHSSNSWSDWGALGLPLLWAENLKWPGIPQLHNPFSQSPAGCGEQRDLPTGGGNTNRHLETTEGRQGQLYTTSLVLLASLLAYKRLLGRGGLPSPSVAECRPGSPLTAEKHRPPC